MVTFLIRGISVIALSAICYSTVTGAQTPDVPAGFIVEAFPDSIQARIELKNRQWASIPRQGPGDQFPELVMLTGNRWTPGKAVKVAFRGGTAELHKFIADACSEWTRHGANIQFDFGLDNQTGKYRSWSLDDTDYSADVRIAFDQSGYWSVVGNDSINREIVSPNQTSLNLAGFDVRLPTDAKGVATHECGHALGAEHEHQNPVNGCDSQFRFEDDAGYVPTKDQFGQYIVDDHGRRPGLYTYLGGPPNNWPQSKVDFNLRQLPNSSAFQVGPFDKLSIMKYYFPSWMFKDGVNSPCYSSTENLTLSSGDITGIASAYPSEPAALSGVMQNRQLVFDRLSKSGNISALTRSHFDLQLNLAR